MATPLQPTPALRAPVTDLLDQVWGAVDTTRGTTALPWQNLSDQTASSFVQIGRFRVSAPIGAGGNGLVFRATDPLIGREVAVKVARPELAFDPVARERFAHEARIAGSLRHPGIVPVLEVGFEGGVLFIVSELCDGPNLATWLRDQDNLCPARAAAALLKQVAQAVAAAHEAGIVHRDIKPGNVLLVRAKNTDDLSKENLLPGGWIPRLTDFGLAKLADAANDFSRTGGTPGTPQYMAPEQTLGQAGPSSDLWALGAILYELLTGRPPFRGTTVPETFRLITATEPVPPRHLCPDLPRDLETICLKCLNKDSARRYPSVGAFAADLARFESGQMIEARPIHVIERAWRVAARHPGPTGLLVTLFLVLSIGIMVSSLYSRRWRTEAVRSTELAATAEEQRQAANEQRRAANRNLFESLLANSANRRLVSGRGQRLEAFASLDQAIEMLNSGDLDDHAGSVRRVRDELLSARLHPDVTVAYEIPCDTSGISVHLTVDDAFHQCCWADSAGTIHIADPRTGRVLRCIPCPPGISNMVDPFIGPRGDVLAAFHDVPGSGDQVVVWDLTTDPPSRRFDHPAVHPNSISFGGHAPVLALGQRGGVVDLVCLKTGKVMSQIRFKDSSTIDKVHCHPTAPLVAYSSINSWEVYWADAETGSELGHIMHQVPVISMAWHPNRPLLAAGCSDGRVHLWDTDRSEELQSVPAHPKGIPALQFSPAGNYLHAAGYGPDTMIWTAPVASPVISLRSGSCLDPKFSADESLFGPELGNGVIRFLRIIDAPEARTFVTESSVDAVPAISPDSRIIAAGTGLNGLGLWDLQTGHLLDWMHYRDAIKLIFQSDTKLLVAGARGGQAPGSVQCIPIDRQSGRFGTPVLVADLSYRNATELTLDRTRTLLAIPAYRGVELWDLEQPSQNLGSGENAVPGGKQPVPVSRKRLNAITSTDLRYCSLDPERRWVAGGAHNGKGAVIWDLATGKQLVHLPTGVHTFVAFSPSGQYLATHDGESRVWHTGSWKPAATLPQSPIRKAMRPAFSEDEKLLAVGDGEGHVRLISTATWETVARIRLDEVVHRLLFSPDSRFLVSISVNGRVTALDLHSLRITAEQRGLGWFD